jgi:hypothetical protein
MSTKKLHTFVRRGVKNDEPTVKIEQITPDSDFVSSKYNKPASYQPLRIRSEWKEASHDQVTLCDHNEYSHN